MGVPWECRYGDEGRGWGRGEELPLWEELSLGLGVGALNRGLFLLFSPDTPWPFIWWNKGSRTRVFR